MRGWDRQPPIPQGRMVAFSGRDSQGKIPSYATALLLPVRKVTKLFPQKRQLHRIEFTIP